MKGEKLMKNIFRRSVGIFGIIITIMLLSTCDDVLNLQVQKDKAVVSFSVTENTARTVFPLVSLDDVVSYVLLGGRNGAVETELIEFTTTVTSLTLDTGTWNFTLNAYNGSGQLILQDKIQNRQINLTGNSQIGFSLTALKSGTGNIQITLNFPVEAGITRISTNGDVSSENFTTISNSNFVYTKNAVNVGDLLVNFELYREDVLRSVVTELVLVRSNLTSSKTITLAGENLKPIPTFYIVFDDQITGISEWDLMVQNTEVIPMEDTAFTTNGSYSSYKWYLDGLLVGTTSSYIFNKPSGIYQLVLVATNSNGESRSGRCRITSKVDYLQSSINTWTAGSITGANQQDWYLFPVVSGTTYYIWWNDSKQGSNKTCDVAVSARYRDSSSWIFGGTNTSVDSGWNTAQSFIANQNGMVEIRVIPYNRSGTGTYGIAYTTDNIKPALYTVTFNTNSGTGTTPTAIVTEVGSSITLPSGSGITRSGYSFNGWNTNDTGTGTNYNAGSSYTPTGNITLYAKWSVSYTVTFNINYGSGTTPAQQIGSTITLPSGSGLTRSGYTFGGWNTNGTGTGTNYSASSSFSPSANITLYARWVWNNNHNNSPLVDGVWVNGNFTSTNQYYLIPLNVVAGTTYRIWWNDSYQGDGTQTADVAVSARYAGLYDNWIFGGFTHGQFSIWENWSLSTTVDNGWSTPQSFTANQNGVVEIFIRPYNNNSTGSFRIVQSTNTTRP